MQLAAAGNLEAVSAVCLLDTERDIGIELLEKAVTDVTGRNPLALLAGKGGIVDHEVHGNGRLIDLLEGNGFNFLRTADRITDGEVGNT